MSHPCAAPQCDRKVPDNHLMCPQHWGAVPPGVQQAVYATWRAYNSTPTSPREPRKAALTEYIEARRAAIEAV